MVWYFWVLLIISMFVFTYLMKLLFNAKIYYFIISMISNKKIVKVLDKIKSNWFWLNISKFGIFLGFGFVGILFWYWHSLLNNKKKPIWPIIFYSILILIVGLFIGNFGLFNDSIIYYIVNVIVFFFFGFAGFGILLLGYQAALIIRGYIIGRASCPGVAPVIPGLTIPGTTFKIPFFEGWIALIIIMIVHEVAHGILARKINVKVKSFGIMLLGYFPIGAFTEPDDKELQNAKPKDALLVYSAGPTINLVFALIVFILMLGLTALFAGYITNIQTTSTDGVYIVDLSEYTGICGLGVNSQNTNVLNPLFNLLDTNKDSFFKNYSAKIISVDNNLINNRKELSNIQNEIVDANTQSVALLLEIQDINKTKDPINYTANIIINSDNTFGITTVELSKSDYNFSFWYLVLIFILTTMQWTYLLSFMVGLFNFIPIKPLDGGAMLPHMINEFIPKKTKESKRKKIIKIVSWSIIIFFLLLLVINALPLFF